MKTRLSQRTLIPPTVARHTSQMRWRLSRDLRWTYFLALVLSVTSPNLDWAGEIMAQWTKDSKSDYDTYRFTDPGAGQILIFNSVAGASTRAYTDTRMGTPGDLR
jgi:hypothetical protein